jgi:ribosomal protein S18 acetylase RimI-like enzyme
MNWEAVLASPGFITEYGLEKLKQQENDYWPAWTPENGPSFIAVTENGQRLGAIMLKSHEPDSVPVRGWRFGIGIVAAARGQGVGRSLIEHSLDFARASGAHYLTLFVDPANQPAVNLYKKLDFKEAGRFGSLVEMRREL